MKKDADMPIKQCSVIIVYKGKQELINLLWTSVFQLLYKLKMDSTADI